MANDTNRCPQAVALLWCAMATAYSSGANDPDTTGAAENGNDFSQRGDPVTPGVLHAAYDWFDGNATVTLDGDEVVIEATGRPDHASADWNPNKATGLCVEPDPTITTVARMSPGYIEEYNNLDTLRASTSLSVARASSLASLGRASIAVSGASIFSDRENPNIDLALDVISGFDRNGASTPAGKSITTTRSREPSATAAQSLSSAADRSGLLPASGPSTVYGTRLKSPTNA